MSAELRWLLTIRGDGSRTCREYNSERYARSAAAAQITAADVVTVALLESRASATEIGPLAA